jgi:hypothetical protein
MIRSSPIPVLPPADSSESVHATDSSNHSTSSSSQQPNPTTGDGGMTTASGVRCPTPTDGGEPATDDMSPRKRARKQQFNGVVVCN